MALSTDCLDDFKNAWDLSSLPNAADWRVASLVHEWAALDAAAREEFTSALSELQARALLAFSERWATLAIRQGNKAQIETGLLALFIDDARFEWRENIPILALHYHACGEVGVEPAAVFNTVKPHLLATGANIVSTFLSRTPHNRSLQVMGYELIGTGLTRRYKRTW